MADLTRRRQQLTRRWEQAMAIASRALERRLVAEAPVDTGRLKSGVRVRNRGLVTDVVVSARSADGTDYASFTRTGTRPHVIRPRRGQYLAFRWDAAPANMGRLPDGRVLARQVQHPGTDPNPWYDDQIEAFPLEIEAALLFQVRGD